MDPQIIDYYNEMPYGIKIIEKLNEEYNDLDDFNRTLLVELQYYRTPNILYPSLKEWEDKMKEVDTFIQEEVTRTIVDKQGYNEVYQSLTCPISIYIIIEKALNQLTNNEDSKNHAISRWTYSKSHEIVSSITSFIQGMALYPSEALSNENCLADIIYKSIQWRLFNKDGLLNELPVFKCIHCKNIDNDIDNNDLCSRCRTI